MSLDKAIAHGKEHRKPYTGVKAIDPTCRNHGTCPWCKSNRLFKFRDKHPPEDKAVTFYSARITVPLEDGETPEDAENRLLDALEPFAIITCNMKDDATDIFLKWLAEQVTSEMFEDGFYAELICRKLLKLGYLKLVDNCYVVRW